MPSIVAAGRPGTNTVSVVQRYLPGIDRRYDGSVESRELHGEGTLERATRDADLMSRGEGVS
jgi:hypothetical protein